MSLDGIPGLSDMPVVGRLFAHTQTKTNQTDIILTLTPHIIRVLDLDEADLRAFRVGRDSLAPSSELAAADRRAAAAAKLRPTPAPSRAGRPSTPCRADRAAQSDRARRALGGVASLNLLDRRAERLQPLDQLRVAALDRLERRQPALPVRGEPRGDERHPGSQIAAVERASAQPAAAR